MDSAKRGQQQRPRGVAMWRSVCNKHWCACSQSSVNIVTLMMLCWCFMLYFFLSGVNAFVFLSRAAQIRRPNHLDCEGAVPPDPSGASLRLRPPLFGANSFQLLVSAILLFSWVTAPSSWPSVGVNVQLDWSLLITTVHYNYCWYWTDLEFFIVHEQSCLINRDEIAVT